MPLTTHTVTLTTKDLDATEDDPTRGALEGVWTVQAVSVAACPLTMTYGQTAFGGTRRVATKNGVAVLKLPATGQEGLEPADAKWRISFAAEDGSTMGPFEFELTEDTTLANILTGNTGVPTPTPSPTATLIATPGNSQIALSWEVDPDGADVDGVYVGRTGAEEPLAAGLTGTDTLTGLTPGVDYDVYADVVVDGERVYRATATATPTAPPPDPDPEPDPEDPPPPPVSERLVGLYYVGYSASTAPDPDRQTFNAFGEWPQIASTYYAPTNLVNAYETTRVNRGISPQLTWSVKEHATWGLNKIRTQTSAAIARIDQFLEGLRVLSEVDPDVKVSIALESEFEVKLNQGTITTVSTAQYAAALDVFHTRVHARAPLVETAYWFGGSDWAKINQVLDAMTVAPKAMHFDPYRNPGASSSATFTQTVSGKVANLRGNSDYIRLGRPPIGISETGTDRSHGDASVAAFVASIRPGLETLDLTHAVYFNRDSGPINNAKLDTGTMPLSVAAMGDAMNPSA